MKDWSTARANELEGGRSGKKALPAANFAVAKSRREKGSDQRKDHIKRRTEFNVFRGNAGTERCVSMQRFDEERRQKVRIVFHLAYVLKSNSVRSVS
jgi:hypothetical protein